MPAAVAERLALRLHSSGRTSSIAICGGTSSIAWGWISYHPLNKNQSSGHNSNGYPTEQHWQTNKHGSSQNRAFTKGRAYYQQKEGMSRYRKKWTSEYALREGGVGVFLTHKSRQPRLRYMYIYGICGRSTSMQPEGLEPCNCLEATAEH